MTSVTTLDGAALGVVHVVEGTGGQSSGSAPAALRRRLAELGLRPGAAITCVQRTAGGGRIVDLAGSRVALGRDVLSMVTVVRPA